jgi:hypothetical protein
MFASFNYHDPTPMILGIGAGIAIVALVSLYFTRSVLAGMFGGACSWGFIAFVVYGFGTGDMTSLVQTGSGMVFGIAGAVAGSIAGLLGRIMRARGLSRSEDVETFRRRSVATDPAYQHGSEAELCQARAASLQVGLPTTQESVSPKPADTPPAI